MLKESDSLQETLHLLILKTLQRGPNDGFGIRVHIQAASDERCVWRRDPFIRHSIGWNESDLLKVHGRLLATDGGHVITRLTNAGFKRLSEAEESWATLMKSVGKVLYA